MWGAEHASRRDQSFMPNGTTPTDKTLLLTMAEHWVRLAERAEARGDSDASDKVEKK